MEAFTWQPCSPAVKGFSSSSFGCQGCLWSSIIDEGRREAQCHKRREESGGEGFSAVPSPFFPGLQTRYGSPPKTDYEGRGPRSVERRRLQRPNQTRPLLLRKLSKPELGRGAGVEGNEGGCFLDYPFFLMGLPSHLDLSPKFREYLFFEGYFLRILG